MNGRDDDQGELPGAISRWRDKREGARHDALSLASALAAAGSLGWLVVLPSLGGVMLGRWLDGRFQGGITYTAAGLLLGVALGSWLLAQALARHGGRA